MVTLRCVHCRKSEERHYWSCPGSPVRGHTEALDKGPALTHVHPLTAAATKDQPMAELSVRPHLLGHLVRVVQRVLPLQEHPLLLGAGQATRQPGG